jgi:hypothetical protein
MEAVQGLTTLISISRVKILGDILMFGVTVAKGQKSRHAPKKWSWCHEQYSNESY